jgi:hypothetical protein
MQYGFLYFVLVCFFHEYRFSTELDVCKYHYNGSEDFCFERLECVYLLTKKKNSLGKRENVLFDYIKNYN